MFLMHLVERIYIYISPPPTDFNFVLFTYFVQISPGRIAICHYEFTPSWDLSSWFLGHKLHISMPIMHQTTESLVTLTCAFGQWT